MEELKHRVWIDRNVGEGMRFKLEARKYVRNNESIVRVMITDE